MEMPNKKIEKSIILVRLAVSICFSGEKPGVIREITWGAKIKKMIPNSIRITINILRIELVISQASFLLSSLSPLFQYFKKIGIKAEERAPKTRMLNIKSGTLKAA